MAKFTGGNEKYISAEDPVVFENKTTSKCEVYPGIVFHKSGIYEISIIGNRTIISEVSRRKIGKWKQGCCSECGYNWGKDALIASVPNFCPNCGADMREDGAE